MSVEYRPVSAIPFDNIDMRLEKHGIKVEFHGGVTVLTGPRGMLFATPDGNSAHFERKLGVDTQAVIEAIETEYGIKIVDENDPRFWGFAGFDDMYCDCLSRPSNSFSRNWMLIEGPPIGRGPFAKEWVESASAADEALKDEFEKRIAVREWCGPVKTENVVEFLSCALALLCLWFNGRGVFGIDLSASEHAGIVALMAAAGFFTRTGERYQMVIPQGINISAVDNAVDHLLETKDEESVLHPEDLVFTMTRRDMEIWKHRLTSMEPSQRAADRDILLGDAC